MSNGFFLSFLLLDFDGALILNLLNTILKLGNLVHDERLHEFCHLNGSDLSGFLFFQDLVGLFVLILAVGVRTALDLSASHNLADEFFSDVTLEDAKVVFIHG